MAVSPLPDFSTFDYFNSLFHETRENSVFLMNKEGIVLEVNKAFMDTFGYNREDIVGQNFAQLFTPEDRLKHMPQKELVTAMERGQAYDNNYLVSKDGRKTWVSGESIIVNDDKGDPYVLKIIQNIDQQKISESSIIRLNDFNETILKSIDDVVLVLDAQMLIVKANDAFTKLFSEPSSAMPVPDFPQFISRFDPHHTLHHKIQHLINTEQGFSNLQLKMETVAGDERIFEISCSPMKHKTGEANILLVGHDITVQKQAEREREDIIGFVAHELRNPLANIMLCNEIMQQLIQEENLGEMSSFLERSKNNVMRLNKMIAELYDATKVNSGNFKLEIQQFNFAGMIREAIDTIEVLQPAYKIIVSGDGNYDIRGDRYRLIQVVTNYLSNGIKYSNGNTEVHIEMKKTGTHVTLAVRDRGLGIPRSQLPFIFERFFRAEKTKNLEGIGLGLFLCRQIIYAHNGEVWAESEEGKGSVFYFSIPL